MVLLAGSLMNGRQAAEQMVVSLQCLAFVRGDFPHNCTNVNSRKHFYAWFVPDFAIRYPTLYVVLVEMRGCQHRMSIEIIID